MIKYRYVVTGVSAEGIYFRGTCVETDIIAAITLFRKDGFSVHTVESRTQVSTDVDNRIEDVEKLGLYERPEKEIILEHLRSQDEYVKDEIVKHFTEDDYQGYQGVRKQILKKQEVTYFKDRK